MIRTQIKVIIQEAVKNSFNVDLTDFEIEYKNDAQKGDYSSNIALVLSSILKNPPLDIAEKLSEKIANSSADIFLRVEVARPGFINFFLKSEFIQKEAIRIFSAKDRFGFVSGFNKKKARVEYVSANPTGPIHLANARGGPLGETFARVLEKEGCEVLREYYQNDVGNQLKNFGNTLLFWYKKEKGEVNQFPEEGYKGEYPHEVANAAINALGENLESDALEKLTNFGIEYMFKENMETLERMGIKFNSVFKESEFLKSGKTAEAINELKEKGLTMEKDRALWFGKEKEDTEKESQEFVLIKSNGEPTYFASDVAYHKEKFTSDYNLIVDVFGANHFGHVPKITALAEIFNFKKENFKIILYQNVRLKKEKEIKTFSKRAGTFITAKEVLDQVGADSMNFFLLMLNPNSHLDFDLDLAKERSQKNPVFYVQYAHARAKNILKKAEEEGINFNIKNISKITDARELALIKEMMRFEEVVWDTANDFQVQRIPHFSIELAKKFHDYYENFRVIGEEANIASARMVLIYAASGVLSETLRLMAIKAPDKM